MDRQKNEIEDILNSLDGLRRANANPYLFEKIKAKLESRTKSTQDRTRTIVGWALAGVLFLVINVATWTALQNDTRPANALNAVAGQLGFSNSTYQY